MRIVIDLQGTQSASRYRGIGRYSLSISKAIIRNRGEHEIIIALSNLFPDTIDGIKKEFRELLPKENIKIWNAVSSVKECDIGNKQRREISEIVREAFLINLKPDIILITSLFEGYWDDAVISVKKFDINTKIAVTNHDLIPYIYQDKYLDTNKRYKNHYLQKIEYLKKADLFLGVSESSCSELIRELNIDNTKVVNTSEAVDENFKVIKLTEIQEKTLLKKYNISKKTIVYAPGGFDIRKNFENLIKAYSVLPKQLKEQYQLIIISKVDGNNKKKLLQFSKNVGLTKDDLILTGYVSDEELISFYSICDLFVFSSIHEGFGLPVLEAMNCGAIVIGSNITSIPEVIGIEDALFDPYSIESIASKIAEVIESSDLQKKLLEHNKKQIKKFSWDKSAKIALEAMEKSYNRRKDNQKFNLNYKDMIKEVSNILVENNSKNDKLIHELSKVIQENRCNLREKTLWIDVSKIISQNFTTGIQRVVKSVLDEIFKLNDLVHDIKLIYLEHSLGQDKELKWVYRFASNYQDKIIKSNVFETNHIIEPKKGDIFLGLDLMSSIADAEKEELFSKWKKIGVKINFVVYDILPISNPEWWPSGGDIVHTKWLKTILKVSDKIICISKAVVDDIQLFVSQNNIEVSNTLEYECFHLGADINTLHFGKGLMKEENEIVCKIKKEISFIMVGTLEPRKGYFQTLKGFTLLWEQGIDVNLLIVGKEGWIVDDLIKLIKNHPQLNKRLFWLNGISDEYLQKVYEVSDCLIAASEGEGFGLPLIEAAQYKIPIIARDIPVFKEVAGEFAYYFENMQDSTIITNTIIDWLTLFEQNKHPRSDNMPWLTWEESTKVLVDTILK